MFLAIVKYSSKTIALNKALKPHAALVHELLVQKYATLPSNLVNWSSLNLHVLLSQLYCYCINLVKVYFIELFSFQENEAGHKNSDSQPHLSSGGVPETPFTKGTHVS